MSFKDTLLALVTHPHPTPSSAVDDAVAIAEALSSQITEIVFEIEFLLPVSANFLANMVVNMPSIIADQRKTSADNAKALIAAFTHSVSLRNISHDCIHERCKPYNLQDSLKKSARLRDLTILAIPNEVYTERTLAESAIFGAGRPVMILPGSAKHSGPRSLDNIVVAWDSSRAAARALSDALPILERAKSVRVVTVEKEKPIDTSGLGDELTRHLARHGIDISFEVINAAGRPIGDALEAYVTDWRADLLVMGAFGHSRARDFILGGATRSMLDRRPLPLLLSH